MNYVANQRFARKGEYQRLLQRYKRAKGREEKAATLRDLRAAFPKTQVGKSKR